MSLSLILQAAAQAEFDDAFDWYEAQRPGLGVTFAARINEVLGRIAENPDQFPVIQADARRAVVGRFPFVIVFRVRPHRISVLAVFHTSRDPRVWQARLG